MKALVPLSLGLFGSWHTPALGQARPAADSTPYIVIGGAVPRPVSVGAAEIQGLPRRSVTAEATDHGLAPATYEGTPLAELLVLAGVTFGQTVRGPRLADVVVVEAADGYRVAFALAELDPGFTDRVVLLADRRDGRPFGSDEGPFRLIVPGEKRPARWIRQVTAVKLVRAP